MKSSILALELLNHKKFQLTDVVVLYIGDLLSDYVFINDKWTYSKIDYIKIIIELIQEELQVDL